MHHHSVAVVAGLCPELEDPETPMIVSYSGGELADGQHIDRPGSDEASRLTDGTNAVASHLRTLENCVDLKICILTDWTIEEVSDQVDDQYSVHEMRFRSGQQEADFLKLLRSFFPLLAPSTAFEFLITDPTNRLQPLEVQSFTPEQICSAAGNSALYIRLKCPVEQEAGSRQQPMQTSDDDFNDEDAPPMELQAAPDAKNEAPQERPAENQSGHNEDIVLKVRLIEDSRIVALSKTVLKKYKSKKLRCHRGMQEAELLKLLVSTFPQLAAGTAFDFLITNSTKKLLPLKAESLTPEQISRAAGNSALYIRLKSVGGNIKSRLKNLLADAPRKKKGSQNKPDQAHINLRIHILEDSGIDVITAEVLRKYRLNKLECRPGMQESDFLDLLRSTFPQLVQFEAFKCDRSRKLLPLHLPSFTPELICTAAGTSALYLRLQHPEEPSDATEEPQQNHQDAERPHPATPSNRNENPDPADDEDAHLNLNICYLEESQMDSSTFSPQLLLQKFPIHVLKCPRGLQQPDFLAFLRSTFSQLASDQPFSVFALQGQKMLQLNLNSVNPEEIGTTIDSLEASVICVQQLKKNPQTEAAESKVPRPRTPQARTQSPSRTTSDPEDLVEMKICIVADPMMDVASPLVLQKYPILTFRCPGSLQEAEFLRLLRTTFPQLAGEALDFQIGLGRDVKPIDLQDMTSDDISRTLRSASGSLLYIRLKEQLSVQASVKRSRVDVSPASKNGIKRKKTSQSRSSRASSEDVETEDSEDDGHQRNATSTEVLGQETDTGPPVQETDKHPDPTPNTDDERTDDSDDERYNQHPLVCKLSLGLQQPGSSGQSSAQDIKAEPADPTEQKPAGEAANSPRDDGETEDSEDYHEPGSAESSRLSSFHPRRPESEMKQDTSKKRLKKEKKKRKKDREKKRKKKEIKLEVGSTNQRLEAVEIVDSEDGGDKKPPVWSLQPWTFGTDATRRTSTGAVKTAKKKTVELSPNKQTNIMTEEVEIINIEDDDDDDDGASSQPQVSDAQQQKTRTEDGDEEEPAAAMENMEAVEIADSNDGDEDSPSSSSSTPQPHVSGRDSQQTSAEARKVLESSAPGPSAAKADGSLAPSGGVQKPLHLCEACHTYHTSRGLLIRHVWRSHVNNHGLVCGVCRQRFDSTAALKKHLQTHKKTYTCEVCGKTFFTKSGCQRHTSRHKGGDPEQK
ncbi:uncharacterized protein LOC103480990 [Poecilia reticulata]|uniref:uncharacterized protein LOC103480990 n=1 Tax=Poecilia reticulata TaxID=8081 RepID=UPI0007EA408B|nr:PREDICTED: uncharacterized protein LOC103480990 [Poecilia reticulata]